MHPFGSYLASKPHLDRLSPSRQAEIDAMYRRPDCPPLPPQVERPSRLHRLIDGLPVLRRLRPDHV